jgi:hypothetical protein
MEQVMAEKKFWFVYRENGRAPSERHTTLASAITEANRLAGIHSGRFFVLEAVGVVIGTVEKMDVKTVECTG